MSAALVPIKKKERAVSALGLRGLRLARGLTQQQLGKIAGVSEQIVCRWEHRGVPSVWVRLGRIADALSCSTDEVLARVPPERFEDAASAENQRLIEAMRDHAVTLIGPKMLDRVGGWRRVAMQGWLAYLVGVRNRHLLPASNKAPRVEEYEGKKRLAMWRWTNGQPWHGPKMPGTDVARPKGRRTPRQKAPPGWYEGWESPRQQALRLKYEQALLANPEPTRPTVEFVGGRGLPNPSRRRRLMAGRGAQ